MNDTLIICITLVVLSVIFSRHVFINNPYTEEIISQQKWQRPNSSSTYRVDYTIKRSYKNGTVKIYIKHIHT